MVLSECTREKVFFFKHAFTTMYKVESGEGKKTKKQEVFFFSFSFFVASVRDLEAKRLGGGGRGWVGGGDSLDSWACTVVSHWFPGTYG